MINERVIFLDVPADRYFCLNSDIEDMFRAWAGKAASLDHDRSDLAALCSQGILVEGPGSGASPASVQGPTHVQDRSTVSGVPILASARAIWMRAAISKNLKSAGFERTLQSLRRAKEASDSKCQSQLATITHIVNAHCIADLAWGAHNKCLPRALALGHDVAMRGHDCQFVIGIALRPFQAHCWVQASACLLNDDLETVRKFKPILVI